MTNDHRDIPMALGLIIMNWNHCEVTLRQMLQDLAAGGDWRRQRLVEPLIHELTSVGIAQALSCYADEMPEDQVDLAAAMRHAGTALERARAYRNYYVHGIYGVTRFGILWNDDMIQSDTPIHEAVSEGPFGSIYQKSGKYKSKFIMDFIDRETLTSLSTHLAEFYDYLHHLELSIRHYFRRLPYRETAPVPQPLPLLDTLEKRALNHPRMRQRHALDLDALQIPPREEE